MMRLFRDLLAAIQFLTRVPVPSTEYDPQSLPRSAKFFPLVGILVGGTGALVHWLLRGHLPDVLVSVGVLLSMILVTGAFHEDGLADVADGFGGGWNREQTLTIMKDSRIGTYGGVALILSLAARLLLLSALPSERFAELVISAHVLCRWTTLPLSYWLKPSNPNGQGARVASNITLLSVVLGTLFSLCIVIPLLHLQSWIPLVAAAVVPLFSGLYYRHKIGGITGDCLGATNQLTEIAVYLCGVWH